MGDVRFTVVLIVRDGARWLTRCLDILLAQERQDMELLVFDLNSSDGTRDILARYEAKLGGGYHRLQDSRWADAAQAAAVIARGEWVMYLDACHWLAQGAMHAFAAAVESNPSAAIITGGVREVAETAIGGIAERTNHAGTASGLALSSLLYTPRLHARLFNRELLLALGGFGIEGISRLPREVAERALLVKYVMAGADHRVITYTVASEIQHHGQAARQRSLASNQQRLDVASRWVAHITSHHSWNQQEIRQITQWLRRERYGAIIAQLRRKDFAAAWKLLGLPVARVGASSTPIAMNQ